MIGSTSPTKVDIALTNKDIVSDSLWRRLVYRVIKDSEFQQYFGLEEEQVQHQWAERIIDQTLAYLRLCAEDTTAQQYVPSALVDIGWHTFLLYTREYAMFCQDIAGRFIHHSPWDEEGVDYGEGDSAETVNAMRVRGITVDEVVWATNMSSAGDPAGPKMCAPTSCSMCSGFGASSGRNGKTIPL
jgi:hypothetical protein